MNKNRPVKYILQGIECWRHRIGKYPIKIDCPYEGGLFLGMPYTARQFERNEESIKAYFSRQGYVVSIMNPLYQCEEDKFETVITVDIVSDSEKSCKRIHPEVDLPEWFDEVRDLVKRHERRTDEIFSTGGDVSMKKVKGVYTSNDIVLRDIETRVQSIVISRQEYMSEMIDCCDDMIVAKALQWIPKDTRTIDSFFALLQTRALPSEQQNLILRQMIPFVDLLDESQRKGIVYLMQNILYYGIPIVRNKALSILSLCSCNDLKLLSDECLMFIASVSETKQMNCSYPAREILEKLKSSET